MTPMSLFQYLSVGKQFDDLDIDWPIIANTKARKQMRLFGYAAAGNSRLT